MDGSRFSSSSQGCCLTVVWKRCRDGALPIRWPLLSCIIPTLFAHFLACHPYIFLHFKCFLYSCIWNTEHAWCQHQGKSYLDMQLGDYVIPFLDPRGRRALHICMHSILHNHFENMAQSMKSENWFAGSYIEQLPSMAYIDIDPSSKQFSIR